jgi:hypothetical protein
MVSEHAPGEALSEIWSGARAGRPAWYAAVQELRRRGTAIVIDSRP